MNRTDEAEQFAMVRLQDLDDTLPLFADRSLQLRDAPVILALMAARNWRTGKSNISSRAIASKIGVDPATCRASLARLKKQGLVAFVANYGEGDNYYMLNPALVFSGTTQQQAIIWEQFRMAVEASAG